MDRVALRGVLSPQPLDDSVSTGAIGVSREATLLAVERRHGRGHNGTTVTV